MSTRLDDIKARVDKASPNHEVRYWVEFADDHDLFANAKDDLTALLAVAEASQSLMETLASVEFRAGALGLTCTQQDARRIAEAVDAYRATVAPLLRDEGPAT